MMTHNVLTALVAMFFWISAPTGALKVDSHNVGQLRHEVAMTSNFNEDEKIGHIAEACAQGAVDLAREHYKISLDWSDASVENVEKILDALYQRRVQDKPTDEQVWNMSKMFGSYIGEVFRKNHGASWGMVTLGSQTFPGLQAKDRQLFWPWAKVQKRLTNGSEDNVWFYYNLIAKTKT
jgi:hypothetical protein